MHYEFEIPGKLPGMNEYTAANRSGPHVGSSMKRKAQSSICAIIKSELRGVRIKSPVWITYRFFEQNKRRDHDNVEAFAHKVIQDALVECRVLADDGWNYVRGDTNTFEVDKDEPRIVVEIEEVE